MASPAGSWGVGGIWTTEQMAKKHNQNPMNSTRLGHEHPLPLIFDVTLKAYINTS